MHSSETLDNTSIFSMLFKGKWFKIVCALGNSDFKMFFDVMDSPSVVERKSQNIIIMRNLNIVKS